MAQLTGEVALITGAGSGVGRAAALALAGAGASVVLAGRTRASLEETAALAGSGPESAWAAPCDVTEPAQVQTLVKEIQGRYGRLDLVVNAAGLNVPDRALGVLSVENWRRTMAANLDGAFYTVHAALPLMRAQGAGAFVHIGSLSIRKIGPLAGAAYTASKAGLTSLSAVLNAEERRHGIRSSVITLGDTDTGFLDLRPKPPTPQERALYVMPEDVAACVLLIASLPARAGVDELVLTSTHVN